MEITPLDIRKQEFKKAFNGYDKQEVESFLEMIAEQMEKLIKENMSFKEQLKDVERKIDDYRRMEKTLQDTLTSAQRTTDELRKNAEMEGKNILKNAKLEAQNILETAKRESSQLRAEIKTLITLKNNFIARFKGLIEAYTKLLEQETLEHKFDVNEFNHILNEPPENVTEIGALFNKREMENQEKEEKDEQSYNDENRGDSSIFKRTQDI